MEVEKNTSTQTGDVISPSIPTDEQFGFPLGKDSTGIIDRQIKSTRWAREQFPNVGRLITIKVIDDATTLTTGDGKVIFNVPLELDNTLISAVEAFITTTSSSGAVTVQVRNITDSVDVLTTAVTIDQGEYDSYTAATPGVINFTNAQLSKSDRIAIDVDGAGTGAKGLAVYLYVRN